VRFAALLRHLDTNGRVPEVSQVRRQPDGEERLADALDVIEARDAIHLTLFSASGNRRGLRVVSNERAPGSGQPLSSASAVRMIDGNARPG
jgi:hypothetical protein